VATKLTKTWLSAHVAEPHLKLLQPQYLQQLNHHLPNRINGETRKLKRTRKTKKTSEAKKARNRRKANTVLSAT